MSSLTKKKLPKSELKKGDLSKEKLLNMYELMLHVRDFDLKVNQMVKRGMVPGMTHLSVGEEAANIGALSALNHDDLITSNHRGHGQVIGKGIDLNGMMAEIMGKATGTCKGKGGSMHIADIDSGNLGANGIVGGGHGMSIGAAYTQKVKNTGKIVVCFFGDGAVNEGSFHETLNLASIWKLPVIFYSINNGYGISTPINSVINIEHNYLRADAYGIPGELIEDGNDVLAVYETFKRAVDYVREGNGPVLLESLTYRWFGHSSSDPGKYRTREEVEEWKERDPLVKFKKYLLDPKNETGVTEEELEKLEKDSKEKIEESVQFAINSPEPELESAYEDIFAD